MIQNLLRYLGLDAETKRLRAEAEKNIETAEVQLTRLRQRFEETSKISATSSKALRRTLSECDFNGQRRAASR